MSYTANGNVEYFLRSKLSGSTEIVAIVSDRIYKGKVPSKTIYPAIVFSYQDGSHSEVVGGHRLYTNTYYSVRAIGLAKCADPDALDSLAQLIDTVLTNASGTNIFVCRATMPIDRSYTEENVDYEERGNIYEIAAIGG